MVLEWTLFPLYQKIRFSAEEGATLSDMMENIYANGPRIHDFLKEMNKKVLSKYDIVTVGEGPGVNLKTGLKYVDENEKN